MDLSFTADCLLDPDVDLSVRIRFIEHQEQQSDHIDNLISEYNQIQLGDLEDLLKGLVLSQSINVFDKFKILGCLVQYAVEGDDDFRKKEIEQLLRTYIPPDHTRELQVVKWLMQFHYLPANSHLPRIFKYLSNSNVPEALRYRNLIDLERENVVLPSVEYFYENHAGSRSKILCSQYLLHRGKKKVRDTVLIDELFQISENKEEDYNVRADAADTILNFGTSQEISRANHLLKDLGGNTKNIYENKQNIHNINIDDVVHLLDSHPPTTPFKEIVKQLNEEKDPNIEGALQRIESEMIRYGGDRRWTGKELLERVWSFISLHPSKEEKAEMMKRLHQELSEANETCSTGHAFRILNVLSGFGTSIKIEIRDQIISNFIGRMNKKLRDYAKTVGQDIADDVIAEMTIRNEKFQKYFIKTLPVVMAELRQEFVPEFVDEDKFEDYSRDAIDSYGGVKDEDLTYEYTTPFVMTASSESTENSLPYGGNTFTFL